MPSFKCALKWPSVHRGAAAKAVVSLAKDFLAAALLAVVDADTAATLLRRLDALLDGVREVRSTGTDVAPKHIAPVALVVDAHGQLHIFVFDLRRVAPDVGLSGNQISGARRHRRDVVSVAASARWRDGRCPRRSHITSQVGMFSYTGLNKQQVLRLRAEHHVYMLESGRLSMAGVTSQNVEPLAAAIAAV